jgi:membrane protease YdiL (CAAX protease family)
VNPESAPRAGARVRWGLPDVFLAWFVGAAASVILALPFYDPDVSADHQPIRLYLATILFQNIGTVLYLIFVSRRKGQGSLGRDFGLVWPFDRLKAAAVLGWTAAGAGLAFLSGILLRPIELIVDLDEPAQDLSRVIERSGTAGRVLLGLCVVFVAPPVEELLFRGALLRSLQRRWSAAVAIFVSAAIFAGIHLLDPGARFVLPALLLLGLVSGYQAVKRGDLARSVLLHLGFNLVAAIGLVVK